MGLGFKRSKQICFCAESCPPYTWPFEQYFVDGFFIVGPSYPSPALFRFERITSAGICLWLSVEKHFGEFGEEQLTKQEAVPLPGGQRAYRWQLSLQSSLGELNIWTKDVFWIEPAFPPVDHQAEASCDLLEFELLHTVVGPLAPMRIRAAYPNACDDADHERRIQTKQILWQP